MMNIELGGYNKPTRQEQEDAVKNDYILVRRIVADNFNKWTMKQKIAIINALLDGGLENDGGIGSV